MLLFDNAGLRLIAWDGKILGIGGFCKDGSTVMTVRSFLPDEGIWNTVTVGGPIPPTRSGHSATLVSNEKVIVFGGEDRRRKLHAEVNILDLNHMLWEEVTIEVFNISFPHQSHLLRILLIFFYKNFSGQTTKPA